MTVAADRFDVVLGTRRGNPNARADGIDRALTLLGNETENIAPLAEADVFAKLQAAADRAHAGLQASLTDPVVLVEGPGFSACCAIADLDPSYGMQAEQLLSLGAGASFRTEDGVAISAVGEEAAMDQLLALVADDPDFWMS